jgi:hypothetical protein
VENDPTNIEDDRQGNKTSPEGDEERDGFGAARDAHSVLVYARAELAPAKKARDDSLQICRSPMQRGINVGAVQSPLDISRGAVARVVSGGMTVCRSSVWPGRASLWRLMSHASPSARNAQIPYQFKSNSYHARP